MDEHTHLRLQALHRPVEQLEDDLRRLHEHVGLGRVPDRSAATDQEIAAVRQLLAEGREEEALRLHRDLTGQGTDETQKVLESLRAGL